MKKIGSYQNREVFWTKYPDILTKELLSENWICLLTSSLSKPDEKIFEQFVRWSIHARISEFKSHGKFSELLHDWFDEILVVEKIEKHIDIEVVTTWHSDEVLADVFWKCFCASSLPDSLDSTNIKVICLDLDGIDRTNELRRYLDRLQKGGYPKE